MDRFTDFEKFLVLLGVATLVLGSVVRLERAKRDQAEAPSPNGEIIQYAGGARTD